MTKYGKNTGFLFAAPSFMQGVASVLDIGGTLVQYNTSETPEEADARAIASDWAVTGKDLSTAMENLGEAKQAK